MHRVTIFLPDGPESVWGDTIHEQHQHISVDDGNKRRTYSGFPYIIYWNEKYGE